MTEPTSNHTGRKPTQSIDRTSRLSMAVRPQFAASIAIAMIALLSTGGCASPEVDEEPRLRTVRTMTAQSVSSARSLTFSGTSRSTQESRLSFRVGGTITALPVSVGDSLRRGDLIAGLDSFQYQLEAQRAQADLVQAQANERNAASNYERAKGLYENNNASRNDLDSARATAESARAQVRALQKQLELSNLNISYTRLTATSDCSVASVDAEINENVTGGTPIATVTCGRGLEAEVPIPESLIRNLTVGQEATVRFDALPGTNFDATISEIGVTARGGATFPVTVAIDGDHEDLRAGLAAEVSFRFGDDEDSSAIRVPLSAVVSGPDGRFVYLAQADGSSGQREATIVRRAIEVGELTDQGIEIVSGVAPGDRVVTAGTSVIQEGFRVLLADSANREALPTSGDES